MKNIITAINNPELNEEIKKEKKFKIVNKDIIYKEGIIEVLEEKKEINLIIINYDLPGKIEIEELIKKIKKINEKLEIIFILEKEDVEKEKKLKKLNIEKIYYNNKINKKSLIKIIKEEDNNEKEKLEKEIIELKKIIEKSKKENIKEKVKNKIEDKIKKENIKKIEKHNKIKNAIIVNENKKNEASEIVLQIAKKIEQSHNKVLIIDINLENKILQNLLNKKNIKKKINKNIRYIEKNINQNIEKKIEKKLYVKINENIKLLTGLSYYRNKNKENYINKIINLIQKNTKTYYLIIIYFYEENKDNKLKIELNKKIEKNLFIISNKYMEIKNFKKELEKNKFLENKNTYILIKPKQPKEKNVINNSIIKKIFKKEKIIKKIN